MNDCSPEINSPSEVVEGSYVVRRPVKVVGKADDLHEETAISSVDGIGVWVQTSNERSADITSGRSCFQLGSTATSRDRHDSVIAKRDGGFRIGA